MEISAISVGESVEVVPDMFRKCISSKWLRFDSATSELKTTNSA